MDVSLLLFPDPVLDAAVTVVAEQRPSHRFNNAEPGVHEMHALPRQHGEMLLGPIGAECLCNEDVVVRGRLGPLGNEVH